MRFIISAVIASAFLLAPAAVPAQDAQPTPAPSPAPEVVPAPLVAAPSTVAAPSAGIDPLDPAAGSFLDTDLDGMEKDALAAYQAQRYDDAARGYLRLLSHDVRNSTAIYNLACCYGLLGRGDLASKTLERAVRSGFGNAALALNDKDFDKVRRDPVFAATLASIQALAEKRSAAGGGVVYLTTPRASRCRVRLPRNYDPKQKTTLLLGLHGFGSNAENFMQIWERMGDPQLIFAALEAPHAMGGGPEPAFSWALPDSPEGHESLDSSEAYVMGALDELKKRYRVGSVYLLGFSQGAGLSYIIGLRHPHDFAGVLPFGGWLRGEGVDAATLERARTLRFFISHGRQDAVIPFDAAEKAKAFLQDRELNVTFAPFDGGHTVAEEPLKKAVQWMKAEAK